MTTQAKSRTSDTDDRRSRGRQREGASFPVGPPRARLPADYTAAFAEIKERIRKQRLRVVLAANAALVLLYWDIGRAILDRQGREGWDARVIDRLSDDLRGAFPDMRGLSPRNLQYMRAFATAWPDRRFVQEVLAQITWYHCVALLDKVKDPKTCLWYARKAREEGWSRNVLVMQIEAKLHERRGNASTNFPATLPPEDSGLPTLLIAAPASEDALTVMTVACVTSSRWPGPRSISPAAVQRRCGRLRRSLRRQSTIEDEGAGRAGYALGTVRFVCLPR